MLASFCIVKWSSAASHRLCSAFLSTTSLCAISFFVLLYSLSNYSERLRDLQSYWYRWFCSCYKGKYSVEFCNSLSFSSLTKSGSLYESRRHRYRPHQINKSLNKNCYNRQWKLSNNRYTDHSETWVYKCRSLSSAWPLYKLLVPERRD